MIYDNLTFIPAWRVTKGGEISRMSVVKERAIWADEGQPGYHETEYAARRTVVKVLERLRRDLDRRLIDARATASSIVYVDPAALEKAGL